MKKLLPLALCAAALFAADSNSVFIRNVTVHPVTGPVVENGSVLVVDGKIEEMGRKTAARNGIRVVDGKGLHLYPGLINAATNVGLSEIEAIRDSVDLDEIGEFNPQLRAEIAFNPSSEHIPVVRAAGITSVIAAAPVPSSPARAH
jgi:imidazolonepropionase-like amidohydrolase